MFAARTMLVLCLFSAAAANAHNPHDPVYALGVSPTHATDTTLFVATVPEMNWSYSDILRSTDDGATWTKLPNGMNNRYNFSAIRLSPNFALDGTVYAATIGDGVYASPDRGNSWTLINTGLRGTSVKKLKIGGAPNSDYALFAALATGGLFRRTASEATWTEVLPTSIKVAVVAPSPDYTTDLTVLVADIAGNLQRSTDGGITLANLGNRVSAIAYDIAIAPGGGAHEIFLATSLSGVFHSADAGATFTRQSSGLPAEAVNNVAVSPNYMVDHTVFCTTLRRSVYRSTNSGSTWTLYPSTAALTYQTTAVNEFSELQVSNTYTSDGAVFLSAFDGLFESSSAGAVWTQKQTRPGFVTGLAFSPNYATDAHLMATDYAERGVYSSSDRGATWAPVWSGWNQPGGKLTVEGVDFLSNQTGSPMAAANANHSQIGFTSDFGATWSVLPVPDMSRSPGAPPTPVYSNIMVTSPQFSTDHEIYLGTRTHGVLQSHDGGATWGRTTGVPITQQVVSMASSPDYGNDHIAMAATLQGQIWRTTDGGVSWSVVGSATIKTLGGTRLESIAFSPNFAVDHLVLVATNNGLYVSNDSGNTWGGVNSADVGPPRIVRQVDFSPNFALDQQIFATVRGGGMYRVTMTASGAVTGSVNIGMPLLQSNAEFTEFRLSPTFAQDATIAGASDYDLYLSTDGGVNWSKLGSPHHF